MGPDNAGPVFHRDRPDSEARGRRHGGRHGGPPPDHTANVELADTLRGLLVRLHAPWLMRYYRRRPVLAVFSMLNSGIAFIILAAIAVATQAPFVFPSLGATAFHAFYLPLDKSSAPRNIVIGHAVSIALAYFSMAVMGTLHARPALAQGMTWQLAGASGLALSLSVAAMVLLHVEHPPAAANALIVVLDSIYQPWKLAAFLGAAVLLALQALAINRLAGIPYPLWNPRPSRSQR